jgi:hypothetical protein
MTYGEHDETNNAFGTRSEPTDGLVPFWAAGRLCYPVRAEMPVYPG